MKKSFLLFIALTFLATPQALAIDTAAKQAFIIDTTTHTVMFNKDGDVQMHPSSMSKLMTIYILFSRLKEGRVKLDDKFTVSEKAWRGGGAASGGSTSFIALGSSISVDDLIHGIIIQSGNDACIVVAEGLSGSEEEFVKEMNRVAKQIGLARSHFANATGLPDPNHLMTARDLATLAEHLINDFPEYYHYFSIREFTYNNIVQHNRNRLLERDIGVDGLKTGHTDEGGYGITLSAKQGERRIILVINGMASDNERVEEGDKLMRWGFREFANKSIVHKGQKVDDAAVWFGTKASVPLVAGEDALLTMQANSTADIKLTVKYTGPLQAPVAKDTHVADLVITGDSVESKTVPLMAGEDVPKLSGFARMMAAFNYYVLHHRPAP